MSSSIVSRDFVPKVSIYKNINTSSGGETFPIIEIYEAIKTEHWSQRVQVYREMSQATKEEEEAAKKYKESIPYFTGSGVFEGRRKANLITEHNGRIVIDLDPVKTNSTGKKTGTIEEGKINEVRALIEQDEFTEACFLSVSGRGLAIVIKIEPDKHLDSFHAIQAYYKNRFNFDIDKSCSDVCRPRFISSDPNLFYSPNSSIFIIGRDYVGHVKRVTAKMIREAGRGEVHNTLIKASRLMGGYVAGNLISEEEGFTHLVECMQTKEGVVSIEIEKKKINDGIGNGKLNPITATMLLIAEKESESEDKVIKEIYGYVHAMNRAGRAWTEADVVLIAEKYCDQISISKTQVENIFKKIFDNNKDEFGIDDKPDIIKVETYLRKKYDFARNVVTQSTEFRRKGESKLDDLNYDSIYRELQHIGFKFTLSKLESLLKSDFVESYNPFADYFQGLPKWDETTDHISKLANYIQVEDQEFYLIQFKKALVRSIGCALYGVENRIVFVFVEEAQETGKSSFIRFLNPFGHKYYTEAPIKNDKDSSFAFSENFIYNMEELSELNKVEVNRLKAIISTATVKERKAYAINAKEQPRRCNFWASTNKTEFLIDTSNTRWLCFNVVKLLWEYKADIDINDVWAQAYSLWHNPGFSCQLTAEEKETRNVKNKEYEVNDLERELIKRIFRVPDPAQYAEFYSNADIFQALVKHWEGPPTSLNSRFIGKIMVQLGFKSHVKKLNGHTVRGFFAELNPEHFKYSEKFASVATIPGPKIEDNNKPEVKQKTKKLF